MLSTTGILKLHLVQVKIKKSQVAQALEIVEATKEERNEIQKKLNQLMNHKRKMVKELLQLQKEQDASRIILQQAEHSIQVFC